MLHAVPRCASTKCGGNVGDGMPRLTDRAVKSASAGRHSDGQGLILEVSASGSRRWLMRYQVAGKRRDMGLGGYPEVSLAQARIAAGEAKACVREGRDPIQAREEAKKVKEPTTKEIIIPPFRHYAGLVVVAQKAKTSNAKVAYQWERHLGPVFCGPILDKPVNQIRTVHIADLLQPIWHTKPEVARKLLPALRRVFEVARIRLRDEFEIDYSNPAQWADLRALGFEPPKQLSRGHMPSLPHAELPAFMSTLRDTKQISSLALQLLILTVVRTDAVIHARWEDIDMENGVWAVPVENLKDKKHRKDAFRVPLSTAALSVLRDAEAIRMSEWVFPGSRNQGRSYSDTVPVSNMAMTELVKRLNEGEREWIDPESGKRIVPHGFRASFKTWGRDKRQDHDLIEECLGHVIGGRVERAYDRTDVLELRRCVMQAWADYCQPPDAS
jgi:integrase